MTLREKINKTKLCCRILNKAIEDGFLQRDPNNEQNILVYKREYQNNPEGWYSENLLEVAIGLVKNRKSFYELCGELQRART